MPFKITNTPPSTTPFLTVNFTGLLLIQPVSDDKCEIGIYRKAPPHNLKIRLVRYPRNGAPVSEDLISGHLQSKWFSISVDSPIHPGVFAYQDNSPFYRIPGTDRPYDIRWAIDLEGDEFYRDKLSTDGGKIHPGVKLDNGVFYSAKTTDPGMVSITRSQRGHHYGMRSIAATIAAAIETVPGSPVFLEWKNGDRTLSGDLDGTRYELDISNEPPPNTTEADELKNYHTALFKKDGSKIWDDEKWTLGAEETIHGSDEIPCMPVILGG